MNNIAINLEKIHFNKDTIEELNKFAKTYKIKVTYYYGYDLLMLHYDDYHEKEPFTIGSMKKYVREYFSMIYKLKYEQNNK